MSKILLPSHLHQVSDTPLGKAPRWLYPDDHCGGGSFLFGLGFSLIVAAVFGIAFAIRYSPLWLLTLSAVPVGIWLIGYDLLFQIRERFARARIRRRECIRCGVKLADESARYCTDCSDAIVS